MKKKSLILFLLLISNALVGQYTQTRVLQVKSENVSEFESEVAKKTSLFNGPESDDRFLTFRILSGPNTNQYMRIRYESKLSGFDYTNQKGYDYWVKNIRPLCIEKGAKFWQKIPTLSYVTEKGGGFGPHKRIDFIAVKPNKNGDFVNWRKRIAEAYKKVGVDYNLSVLRVISGSDYARLYQVRRNFKNFEHEMESRTIMPKIREAYEALYGKNSWQNDLNKYISSRIWVHTRHHKLIPELSSQNSN